jgi:hypothetical protein
MADSMARRQSRRSAEQFGRRGATTVRVKILSSSVTSGKSSWKRRQESSTAGTEGGHDA